MIKTSENYLQKIKKKNLGIDTWQLLTMHGNTEKTL